MIPIEPCGKTEVHGEHEWEDGPTTSWCEGVRLPPVRNENDRKGNGTVGGRQDF